MISIYLLVAVKSSAITVIILPTPHASHCHHQIFIWTRLSFASLGKFSFQEICSLFFVSDPTPRNKHWTCWGRFLTKVKSLVFRIKLAEIFLTIVISHPYCCEALDLILTVLFLLNMKTYMIQCFMTKFFKNKRTRRKENEKVKEENGGRGKKEEGKGGWEVGKEKMRAHPNCESFKQVHFLMSTLNAHGSNSHGALNYNRRLETWMGVWVYLLFQRTGAWFPVLISVAHDYL